MLGQLLLDLFSVDAPAPPAPRRPDRLQGDQGVQGAQGPRGSMAGPQDGPVPAQDAPPHTEQAGLPLGPSALSYRHPQAKRQILLEGVAVAYAFRRARRRTIGFSVDAQGLSVSAPSWVPWREIEQALLEKGPWILRKLQQSQQRLQQIDASRIVWREGAQVPYLGRSLTLRLVPTQLGSDAAIADDRLELGLAMGASAEQMRDAAQAWLMRRARLHFESRLNHFAPQLGVRWSRLSLSSAATRWGSAGADGSIRLHWRLIHFSPAVIDYVVVHELSHLRVMDHSPRFWQTVGSVVPDYAQLRRQLSEHPIAQW